MFKLNNFSWSNLESALDRKFITQKSRDLVKMAVDGNVSAYVKALCDYTWFGTSDYTMLNIALSPLLLAKKVEGKDGFLDIQKAYNNLSPMGLAALWQAFATGKGSSIRTLLDGTQCESYRMLFYEIVRAGMKILAPEMEERDVLKTGEKIWTSFVKKCGRMTPWSFVNREIVVEQLLPCLWSLSSDIARALEKGMGKIPTKVSDVENVYDELRNIKCGDKSGLDRFMKEYALSSEDMQKLKDISKASERIMGDTAKKKIASEAMKILRVEGSVILVADLIEKFDELKDEDFKKKLYAVIVVSLMDTAYGKNLVAGNEAVLGKVDLWKQIGVELPTLLGEGANAFAEGVSEVHENVQKWWENKEPSLISQGISKILKWMNKTLDGLNDK